MKEIFGGILIGVGVLIAGGSGLCSLAVLFGDGFNGADMSVLPLVLVIGGIPFAIGVAIGFGGYALLQSGRRERLRDVDDTFQ